MLPTFSKLISFFQSSFLPGEFVIINLVKEYDLQA